MLTRLETVFLLSLGFRLGLFQILAGVTKVYRRQQFRLFIQDVDHIRPQLWHKRGERDGCRRAQGLWTAGWEAPAEIESGGRIAQDAWIFAQPADVLPMDGENVAFFGHPADPFPRRSKRYGYAKKAPTSPRVV